MIINLELCKQVIFLPILQLFGPRWNPNIPRFAANLGFSPLEPVKASESQKIASHTLNKIPNPLVTEVSMIFLNKIFH